MNSQSSSSSIISTERVGKSYNLQTGLQRFVRQAKSAIEFCAARIALPRQRQTDNPRSFFRFAPLVETDRDEYQQLLKGAKRLAEEHAVVRGVEVTGELYDLILFCVHSFVRPTSTELYALKHNDITVEKDPKRLLVTGHELMWMTFALNVRFTSISGKRMAPCRKSAFGSGADFQALATR